MVVKMKPDATKEEVDRVAQELQDYGIVPDVSRGREFTVIGMRGDESEVDGDHIRALPGVYDVDFLQEQIGHKEASRRYHPEDAVVKVGDNDVEMVYIGNKTPTYVVGPCAVESGDQLRKTARSIKRMSEEDEFGQYILRGGVRKRRSKPRSFQGLGEKGVGLMEEVRKEFRIPVVTEILSTEYVQSDGEGMDMLQVGAGNIANTELLKKVGQTGKPVLYKSDPGDSTLTPWLQYACYILGGRKEDMDANAVLCLRGTNHMGRGNPKSRFALDMTAVPALRTETYLPVIVDASHPSGSRELVPDVAMGGIASGAHGIMIESHIDPENARSDGAQQLTPEELKVTIDACNDIFQTRKEYRSSWEKVARIRNEHHTTFK